MTGATIYRVGAVFIEDNWSDKLAFITDDEDDVHKNCLSILQKHAKFRPWASTKQFVKQALWKSKTDSLAQEEESSNLGNVATSSGQPHKTPQKAAAKKRALKRQVSDMSVPDDLISPAAKRSTTRPT